MLDLKERIKAIVKCRYEGREPLDYIEKRDMALAFEIAAAVKRTDATLIGLTFAGLPPTKETELAGKLNNALLAEAEELNKHSAL